MEEPFEMDTLENLVKRAIKLLRAYQPQDKPYCGCFSGGKDSVVIKALAAMAGVNVTWHYNVTTIDPPELVGFIRKHHQDVIFEKAPMNFFRLCVVHHALPTRVARFCCKELKELRTPKGETMILGVRSSESVRRAKRWQMTSNDSHTGNLQIAPILGWRNEDVWQFIRAHGIPYCHLYDEGFKRLGCIGCSMAGTKGRMKQFARWPRFEMLYRKALQEIFDTYGSKHFQSADEWWDWWIQDRAPIPEKKGCDQFHDMFDQA